MALTTQMLLRSIADVTVWKQLTLAELDECDPTARQRALFSQADLVREIDRRWGPEALERVAQVITAGKFSPDDELRWLDEDPEAFFKIVKGELTFEDWIGEP